MPAALITGASTGIGRELAYIAAENGYDVALVARTAESLGTVAADVERKTSRKAHIFPIDLAVPNAARALIANIAQAGLTVDVLVNNAGFGLVGKFWDLPDDEQMQMIQLNIGALTQLTRLYLPDMIERRTGYILNVASTAAFVPGPLMAVYYATKAYVLSFSEALAEEVRGSGVTVTALCPGATVSGFQARAAMEASKLVKGKRLMDAATVAQAGYDGFRRGASVVIPGFQNRLLVQSVRFTPRRWVTRIVHRMQERVDA